MYVLLAYDEDWYTFETFMGVFSTEEKAKEVRDNDYWIDKWEDDNGELIEEKAFNHNEYKIIEITLDKPFR